MSMRNAKEIEKEKELINYAYAMQCNAKEVVNYRECVCVIWKLIYSIRLEIYCLLF